MEWIEIMLLSIGCLMIVVAIHTVATYPNRLLRLREQAAIAAAEYRIAVLVYWKEHPPSLDAIPFTFILRRVNEAIPSTQAHAHWYHPFIIWRWKQLRSADVDLWARVIRYAESRELIM